MAAFPKLFRLRFSNDLEPGRLLLQLGCLIASILQRCLQLGDLDLEIIYPLLTRIVVDAVFANRRPCRSNLGGLGWGGLGWAGLGWVGLGWVGW